MPGAGLNGASPGGARQINRRVVMSVILQSGPLSRAELAKAVGLTPAAVSSVVRDLLDEELIEELAPTVSGGVGKPATPLAIRPDGRSIAVVDLSGRDAMTGALVSLDGEVTLRVHVSRGGRVGADAVASLRDLCETLLDASERPLLGLGIAAPGVVTDSRRVVESTRLAWSDVDLTTALDDLADVRVIVANDANVGALGELVFGEAQRDDMFYVRIDDGVGAGIVLGGHLHVGAMGGGGEIGHIVVDPLGPPCPCGKRGCLEMVVSEPLSADPDAATIAAAGRSLGAGLAGIVSTLDIDRIVIGGIKTALDRRFLLAVRDEIVDRTLAVFGERLAVRATSLHDDDVLLGAAAIILESELGVR